MKYIGNHPSIEIVQEYADKWDYVSTSDPAATTNPSTLYATWLNSSNGNVFTCTDNTEDANVWIPLAGHRGVLLYSTSSTTLTNSTIVPIEFDTEIYDTHGFHEGVTNPDRITIPTGVSTVRVTGCVAIASNSTGERLVRVHKNGNASVAGLGQLRVNANSTTITTLNVACAVMEVTSGDYFQIVGYQSSGSDLDTNVTFTWFGLEVIS